MDKQASDKARDYRLMIQAVFAALPVMGFKAVNDNKMTVGYSSKDTHIDARVSIELTQSIHTSYVVAVKSNGKTSGTYLYYTPAEFPLLLEDVAKLLNDLPSIDPLPL